MSQAFLGKIGLNIRGIQIEYEKQTILIRCFFDKNISDEDYEEIGEIETEMISSIYGNYNIVSSCIKIDSPNPLPWKDSTEWFYLRKENGLLSVSVICFNL